MKPSYSVVIAVLTGISLLSAGKVQAASLTIDTFSQTTGDDQFVQVIGVNPNPPSNFLEQGNFTSVIGGYRDLFLTNVAGTTGRRSASAVIEPAESQTLFYNNDTGVSSRLEVTWDGLDNSSTVNTTGLGGVDLTRSGNLEALSVLFLRADQSEAAIMNLWDMNGNQSRASFIFPSIITNERVNFFYNAADFNVGTGNKALFSPVTTNGVDFTKIGAIQLQLRGEPSTLTALDAEIDIVESVDLVPEVAEVPEHTSIVSLLAVTGLVLVWGGKKKTETDDDQKSID